MPRKPTQTTHELRIPTLNGGSGKWSNFKLGNRGNCSWEDASADLLKGAVVSATQDGAAVLFSRTSDGGALSLQVLQDKETHKLYPATVEEIREALQLIIKLCI